MIAVVNGVDIVEINRFHQLDPKIKERFLTRVFSRAERAECSDMVQSLAGKFAGKEAASKALGCGIGVLHWQDLEILKDEQGKPQLHLHERAAEIARQQGWFSWSVSISHTSTHAVAMVTALFGTVGRQGEP